MVNGWKVTAIIFMVLFVTLVGFIFWANTLVNEDTERENQCLYNICSEGSYYKYYDFEKVCECYDENYELIKQEYME